MIPLPDDSVLSHNLMKRFEEVISDTSNRAKKFDAAMQELGVTLQRGNWALAELMFWFDEMKLWKELKYIDSEGAERNYESFVEYIKASDFIPFQPAWAYILKGIYKTYRYELQIGRNTPDLLEKLLNVGNFDKLHIIRKVVNAENVGYWLDVAAAMSKEELDLTVEKSLLDSAERVRMPERVRIIPKRWKANRLSVGDITSKTIAELIEDIELPDNAYVDVTVEIVDYELEGDDETEEDA